MTPIAWAYMEIVRDLSRSGVLTLTLNRPQRLNALSMSLSREMLAAINAMNADPAVRVLLLRGEGRAFCAGKDRDDPSTPEFVDLMQQLAAALMSTGKPVVAAVQGWAVGGGLEMLLNCDIVVAAPDTQFMLPELKLGLFGTNGVAALLPRKIGLAKAKGILLLGEPFSAADAERWGVIWKVADDYMGAAIDIANQLASRETRSLAEAKWLLHRELIDDFDLSLAREADVHSRLGESVRRRK